VFRKEFDQSSSLVDDVFDADSIGGHPTTLQVNV
jgi:hypothetical protein